MVIRYNDVLNVITTLADEEKLRVTVVSSVKGGLVAGALAAAGGLLFGRAGLVLGGAVGGVMAYSTSEEFKSVSHVISYEMKPIDQDALVRSVQNIIEGLDIRDAIDLIELIQGNRTLKAKIICEIMTFLKQALDMELVQCEQLKSVVEPVSCKRRSNNVAIVDQVSHLAPTSKVSHSDGKSSAAAAAAAAASADQEVERLGDAAKRKRRSSKKKPFRQNYNWFLAMRISNPEVHCEMKRAQHFLLDFQPELQPSLVPVSKAHITLFLFDLDQGDEVDAVCDAIQDAVDEYKKEERELPITFDLEGTDHFDSRVLYVRSTCSASDGSQGRFDRLWTTLGSHLHGGGFVTEYKADPASFMPHVTLMKMSRMPRTKIKTFSKEVLDLTVGMRFGSQTVTSLELLSMRKPVPDECGYYFCHKEFPIADGVADPSEQPNDQVQDRGSRQQLPAVISETREPETESFLPQFSRLGSWLASSLPVLIVGGTLLVCALIKRRISGNQ